MVTRSRYKAYEINKNIIRIQLQRQGTSPDDDPSAWLQDGSDVFFDEQGKPYVFEGRNARALGAEEVVEFDYTELPLATVERHER